MAFKLNINTLTGGIAYDPQGGPDRFNPALTTSPTGWHRPILQRNVAAIRKGQYSWARLSILAKTLPRTAAKARQDGDVWTAHWADQVMAAIEVHGHKVGYPRKAE